MEIILIEHIAKLGKIGDIVTVRAGYARNYLLPFHKAIRVSKENLEYFEKEKETILLRNKDTQQAAQHIAEKIHDTSYTIIRQASDNGQLYGSVSSRNIADTLQEAGIEILRTHIILHKPLKKIGLFSVSLDLHPEVTATITIIIARSADEAKKFLKKTNPEKNSQESHDTFPQTEVALNDADTPPNVSDPDQ